MHVGEISFCDKVAYNIKSEDAKKYILNRLEKKYGLKIIHKHYDRFIEEKSLPILKQNPHLVCVRSNGNPYFLCLMKYNFIQYAVFIDKKVQQGYYLPRMIVVHMMFDDVVFNDTIFEGEMIKTKSGWFFLINDMLVDQGQHLNDVNHPRRINALYDVLDKHYSYDQYDLFKLGVKTFFRYNELDQMLQHHIESLPYTCRGVYFKPLYLKFKDILCNFDDNVIKKVERIKYKDIMKQAFILKPDAMSSSSSVSSESGTTTPKQCSNVLEEGIKQFLVRKTSTPDVYELYDPCSGVMIGHPCVPGLRISKKMRELTKDSNLVDKVQASFVYNDKFSKYMLLMEDLIN